MKNQNKLDKAVVPIPNAANSVTPNLAIKAVSIKAVNGSAVSANKTGIDNPIKVLLGRVLNG